MKPRNKREREVTELSSKLPPISDEQKEWAKEHIFPHEAYKCAGWYWCSDCGEQWYMEGREENGYIECPYCHKKLKVVTSRKKKSREIEYMTIATISKGYQVLRHIYCERWTRKKGTTQHPSEGSGYYFKEVIQEWIDTTGKRTIMALPMNMGCNGWLYSEDLSIKDTYGSYYGYSSNKYAIQGEVYPIVQLLPILKKYGLKRSNKDYICSPIIERLLQGANDIELCLKTKQYSMLVYMIKRGVYQIKYKKSFNICNRNHYIIKDASMWDDYMDLLIYFNKDIRNAKFICPKNLKKEHDILFRRKRKREDELRRQREHEQAIKITLRLKDDIMKFYKTHIKFFGIEIKGNGITIHPLESVTQFYQESAAMHHCVFSNGYYKRSDCLILSAKDANGKRLETIEINLKTFEIIQSRAVCNGQTERHKDIIKLVESNINLIKQRLAA